MDKAWFASRYDRGDADYVNCAMDKDEYLAFVEALKTAEEAPVHGFEDKHVFEGCMPVEVMARRGVDTLRYGPVEARWVSRTRRRDMSRMPLCSCARIMPLGSVYNIVGFQTHLKFPEQKRVFSMIPALHDAEFVRYGVMHRNTFLGLLRVYSTGTMPTGATRWSPLPGQMTGVEGYVESTASGYLAGVSMAAKLKGGAPLPDFPTRNCHRRAGSSTFQRYERRLVPADEREFRHSDAA